MRVKVKVCGVRRPEDVEACIEAGIDAVGFNFWPKSKRYLPPGTARALVERLPAGILPVGIFVGASRAEVAAAVQASGVRAAQLHGGEDPGLFTGLGIELIQVVRISGRESLPTAAASPAAGLVLLDADVAGFGGSGARFDWVLVESARKVLGRPVLLAGGLTAGNVAQAVRVARPWGVDVASGVESAPGEKDPARLRAFVAAVRSAWSP